MGEYLRYRSALPPQLREFAILATAAHWQQRFEWDIHAPLALNAIGICGYYALLAMILNSRQ